MDPKLKVSLMGHCVICLRKVRDGDWDDDVKGEEKFNVDNSSKFAKSFNEFWTILKCGGEQNSGRISLTRALNCRGGQGGGAITYFSVAPTLCRQCGDKVVAVENLMEAVRQHVREVELILVKSRRKGGGRLREFEKHLRENGMSESVIQSTLQFVHISGRCQGQIQIQGQHQPIEDQDGGGDEMKVKVEEDGQEPETGTQVVEEKPVPSQITSDVGAAEEPMECDEYTGNFLDDGNNEEGDDSNWAWDEDDPDYIKSEEEEDDDEEDEAEIPLDEEVPSTSFGVGYTATDPLDPLASAVTTKYNCPYPNCLKIFSNTVVLQSHMDKCPRGRPPDTREKKYTCDVPNCGREFSTQIGFTIHREKSHLEDTNYLKFGCSCGRAFPTEERRYEHQRRQKDTHPEFKPRISLIASGRGQQCDMCGEMVEFSKIFKHVKGHVGQQYVLRCPNTRECKCMFSSLREMMYHFLRVKGKNCKEIGREMKSGLVCEACGFVGGNALVIRTHLTDMHERDAREKRLKCPVSGCGKMFCLKQSVWCHLHVHQKKRIAKQNCDRCGKGVGVEEMEGHLREKHGIEEVIGCGHCPMKFGGRDEMVEHLWEHREKGLSCDICEGGDKPVKYSRYSQFREHYWGMHKLCPKRYRCGEKGCGFRVWRKCNLGTHVHDKISGEVIRPDVKKKKKDNKCEICFEDVTFTTEQALLSHKIKVHGEDPFRCDICGETFHDKTKFSRHKKEHAGVEFQKEWKCEEEGCGRIFKEKKGLKIHRVNMHGEGEMKHVCDFCGKGFAFPQGLKTHRDSVHLGLRKYVCDECGESFTSGTTLKKHKLIHTGERPFGCEICGQRFRHKEVLKTHVKGHEEKGANFRPNGPMKQLRKRKAQ